METIDSLNNGCCYCFTDCEYNEDQLRRLIASTEVLDCIHPGDSVFIKPNWVQERHQRRDEWVQMITNPAVISAVLDISLEKLKGSGSIIVGDSPMTPANFEKIVKLMPVEHWKESCEKCGVAFELVDMRNERWNVSKDGVILSTVELPGDPAGRVLFNLRGRMSEFYSKSAGGFYGASYDTGETNAAHNGDTNLYEMGKSVMQADVFVNLPKLKTHKKAGLTCCLKNLIGVSTNKNLLPHHTEGTPAEGGDQFAESSAARKAEGIATGYAKNIARSLKLVAPLLVPLKWLAKKIMGDNKEVVRNGSWYGNDTLWRTIIDLNKILFYGNPDGTIGERPRKRYAAVVDGIVGGQGEGPLEPDSLAAGVLLCGNNPVAVDAIAAKVMGFDYRKIPSVAKGFVIDELPLISDMEEVVCSVNGSDFKSIQEIEPVVQFRPSVGWAGHIELDV